MSSDFGIRGCWPVSLISCQLWMIFRFNDISGLKMVLVMELEAMEESRKELLQRLSGLGAKMENPDMFDTERAGNCSICQPDMKGPSCAHCEAEELFQVM